MPPSAHKGAVRVANRTSLILPASNRAFQCIWTWDVHSGPRPGSRGLTAREVSPKISVVRYVVLAFSIGKHAGRERLVPKATFLLRRKGAGVSRPSPRCPQLTRQISAVVGAGRRRTLTGTLMLKDGRAVARWRRVSRAASTPSEVRRCL